jgi:hypothetical protein
MAFDVPPKTPESACVMGNLWADLGSFSFLGLESFLTWTAARGANLRLVDSFGRGLRTSEPWIHFEMRDARRLWRSTTSGARSTLMAEVERIPSGPRTSSLNAGRPTIAETNWHARRGSYGNLTGTRLRIV